MTHVMFSILGFLLAVGLLVVVHEWGHFWVARRLGVKVLRFAIGFGPVMYAWRRGETEYALSAIPLGGYVKMLDHREGEVDPAEAGRAFDRQSLAKRSAIVVAGPLANLIFAVLAYTAMFMVGVQGLAPIVNTPPTGTAAQQAGLKAGAEVVAVNGQAINTFDALRVKVMQAAASNQVITLDVRDDALNSNATTVQQIVLPGAPYPLFASREDPLSQLGLRPWQPQNAALVVKKLVAEAPAEQGGLRVGDVITGYEGNMLVKADDLLSLIRSHPGQRLSLDILRDGHTLQVSVIPTSKTEKAESFGYIGAGFALDIPQSLRERLWRLDRLGLWAAFSAASIKTWDMSVLSLQVMGKMLTGQASLESISGPLGIADIAGHTLVLGLSTFLGFLALVSLSLAILNLLPVPILDGGHLLFYAIEAVRGQPLSEQTQLVGQKFGLSLLLALMALAMFNDLSRLFF
ncbi:MAG: RIP metalloprotease RseP [Gammaproteobacteria bacterium 28-57-27]|nr:MAG: RIP metalloprotease RseP [Gammaproteobacteria bacterium 28-57-27]